MWAIWLRNDRRFVMKSSLMGDIIEPYILYSRDNANNVARAFFPIHGVVVPWDEQAKRIHESGS